MSEILEWVSWWTFPVLSVESPIDRWISWQRGSAFCRFSEQSTSYFASGCNAVVIPRRFDSTQANSSKCIFFAILDLRCDKHWRHILINNPYFHRREMLSTIVQTLLRSITDSCSPLLLTFFLTLFTSKNIPNRFWVFIMTHNQNRLFDCSTSI